MTNLANFSFAASQGDVLTCNNNGQGLTNTPQQLQDGDGNGTPIYLTLLSVNFDRTGGNTFNLDGIALTASATNINNVCGSSPAFSGSVPLQLPTGTTGQRPATPSNGMIWYNTTLSAVEVYQAGTWVQIS